MSTALVLGAGIGGLLAAGALSSYYDEVVILERDRLPSTPVPRIGVPQGPQVHAVMKRGEIAIETILPGFRDRLAAAGGTIIRAGLDFSIHEGGGWHPTNDLGFTISTQTRALLELVIRRRLLENANVTIRDGYRFRDLVFDANGRVGGVVVEAEERETVPADLVIDAMGRSSLVPDRLLDRGLGEAPTQTTGIELSYSTILLHRPAKWRDKPWVCVLRATPPDHTRGATLIPIEGDRTLLSLVGRFGDRPPTALEDCIAFTKNLEAPEIYKRVKDAECAVPGKRFHIPGTQIRRFDQMTEYPLGLLPLGDVIAYFNPLLAQGMTVAALHAETLGKTMAACRRDDGGIDPARLAKEYIPAVSKLSLGVWTAGAYADMLYPATTGERPTDFEEYHRFRRALRAMINEDPELQRLAMRVQQMLDRSDVLPREAILARA